VWFFRAVALDLDGHEPWKAVRTRHAVRRVRGRLALSRLASSHAAPVLLTAPAASLGAEAESVSEKRR